MNPRPQFWRSIEELAQDPAFLEQVQDEFAVEAAVWDDPVSRRQFLKLMAASLGLAGLTACGMPREKIVPYVRAPEQIVPGVPLYYATAMTLGGLALGLLVQSREGRPIKIEGNPQHPASLGATDVFAQAAILTLYDPQRSQAVLRAGAPSTWDAATEALQQALGEQRARRGAGLRILTGAVSSPTLAAQLERVLALYPEARWHQFEPVHSDNALVAAQRAFGEPVQTRYHFDQAARILSLDADFLGNVRYARDFMVGRRVRVGTTDMNRLYVIESSPTNTGAQADHCRRVRPEQVEVLARALWTGNGTDAWLAAVAADLAAHPGRCLVVAGDGQPPAVHLVAHLLNERWGNVGRTVEYTEPVLARPTVQTDSIRELTETIQAGAVDILLLVETNPVLTAPADLRMAEALGRVPLCFQLSLYRNETTPYCAWHLPGSHFLEAWGDARSFDGTATIQQPLIAPLYQTRSELEWLGSLTGATRSGYELVRDHWRGHGLADEDQWETALHDGVVPGTTLAAKPVRVRGGFSPVPAEKPAEGLSLVIRPDPNLYDGRFAPNAWLQELPKPLSRLSWTNAAWISPATAARLGLVNEMVVELKLGAHRTSGPVWIMPGQPDEVVTVHLAGEGFSAYPLRTAGRMWFASDLRLRPLDQRVPLPTMQLQQTMVGRDLVQVGTLAQFHRNPDFVHAETPEHSLYPEYEYPQFKWGMVIDLTTCIGCAACVVACQAENNIPVVGPIEVGRGRIMHWLRVDRYFEGDPREPVIHFEPVPCMHCEKAPCEVVCPVAATVHDSDGLNQMVYNRCVGTRYCSNNCPYKVRRFNFLQYANTTTESLKLLWNPEVTVRNRGVMEKCTYCIQRIQHVKINAKVQNLPIPDGTIMTACAQACPTEAIVFGDLNDAASRVAQLRSQPHNYGLLAELNTRPRTTYLARIRNPNPQLVSPVLPLQEAPAAR